MTPQRRKWIVAGVTIAVVGMVAAAVCWFVAGARHDDAVSGLARAPVNCDTTLDFAEPGVYLIFVETEGTFPSVRGDCGASGSFSVAGDTPPSVEVTVLDPDGSELQLINRRGDASYDSGGSRGESRFAIEVTEAGDHVIRVEAGGGEQFAVAVGRDPDDGVAAIRTIGLIAGLLALVGGVLIAVLGGRSGRDDGVPAAPGA